MIDLNSVYYKGYFKNEKENDSASTGVLNEVKLA